MIADICFKVDGNISDIRLDYITFVLSNTCRMTIGAGDNSWSNYDWEHSKGKTKCTLQWTQVEASIEDGEWDTQEGKENLWQNIKEVFEYQLYNHDKSEEWLGSDMSIFSCFTIYDNGKSFDLLKILKQNNK